MRPGLATIDGMPPADPQYGDCVVTRHHDPADPHGPLTIDRADPVILVSRQILQQLLSGAALRYAQVKLADVIPADDIYLGATLRITGTNQAVVYRITRRHDEHTYVAEWPD